jgi:hypothetical protein
MTFADLGDNTVGAIAIVCVFGIFPFAIAYARLIWKRASEPTRPRTSISDTATEQRLLAIQQSVDAIAIEVERLSEGQRFVTKVLAEGSEPVKQVTRASSSKRPPT